MYCFNGNIKERGQPNELIINLRHKQKQIMSPGRTKVIIITSNNNTIKTKIERKKRKITYISIQSWFNSHNSISVINHINRTREKNHDPFNRYGRKYIIYYQ